MNSADIYYFAYGANMSLKKLRGHAPSAAPIGVGRLRDWQFALTKVGHDGFARATIQPEKGREVWGVIYCMSATDKHSLDKLEGLNKGYREEKFSIDSIDGNAFEAVAYVGIRLAENLQVTDWYLKHIVAGAIEHALPLDYVDVIGALAAGRVV